MNRYRCPAVAVTLEEAGKHITKLSKPGYEAAQWRAAMENLVLVATPGGPTTSARIGFMLALNPESCRNM